MRVFQRVLAALTVLIASTTFALDASAATYRLTDLNVLFPNANDSFQLNNVGHIMGHAIDPQLPAPNRYTFIYANGAITRLASPPQTYADSFGFNDNDEMTGSLYRYASDGVTVTSSGIFLYKNRQLTDITNVLPKAQSPTNIQTINNAGVLLGNYSSHSSTLYLYDTINDRAITVLNTFGYNVATALNNAGQVTGQNFFSGLYHAFLYSSTGVTEIGSFTAVPRDTNDVSFGLGINDAGKVVGYAGTPSGYSHAFLYQSGVMTDLGTLSGFHSSANDINNANIIVGASGNASNDMHAFIYDSNAMVDLNTLIDPSDPLAANVVLTTATTINDRGEILATGHYANGRTASFLLTPTQTVADTAYYNFEQTTHNWYNSGEDIVSVTSSNAQKFAGSSSLAVQFNGNGYVSVGTMYPPLLAGKTLTFHIYIPVEAPIDWVQPFALEDYAGNWTWHGNWQAANSLQPGEWNTLTLEIPANATPMYRMGMEIYTSQPYTGTVYIDSISF